MSLAKAKKRCCRACLKEIRSAITSTNLLDPPTPAVQLRGGVKAKTYLQCYIYICLRNDSSHFNSESLPDYAYICSKCKGHLMRAVDFIVKSQRNEDFLISMYDDSTHDITSADLGDDLLSTNDDDDVGNKKSNENKSENDMTDENLNIIEGSRCETEEESLEYIDSNFEICETEVDHTEDDVSTKENVIYMEDEAVEKESVNSEVIEGFEQVIIDTSKIEEQTVKLIRVEKLPLKKVPKYDPRKKEPPPYKRKCHYFKCELCRKAFKLERLLYEHYDNEHDQRSLNFHCNICKNRHISEKALMFHKRRIHKNIEYEDCEVCGRLILSASFKTHKERHDSDAKYECESCDRTFATKVTLNKHCKAVHGDRKVRRYECPDCDRYFFSSDNLKLHSTVHDKNNPEEESKYLCDICSKTFVNQTNLKVHMQMHRGENMKCPHCEKEFVRLKDMEIHIRFHTKDFPFKCDICSRRFGIKTHLDHHRKQHEGVRYKCQICDKDFGHSFSLRQHSFQHRGYPLSCKLCSKGFPSLFKIRRHVKNIHSSEFAGEYSDSLADQYYQRHKIGKMYPRVEYLGVKNH